MSDVTLWIARILGVFYLAGGVMVLRTMLASETMDGLLRVLERRDASVHERTRLALLGVGAVLTAMAGTALLLDSVLALPLFVANGLVQATWLLYAKGAFPPEDAEEALGRRRSGNAFIGWLGVTALVGWLAWDGRLVDAGDPMRLAVVAVIGAGLTGWYLVSRRRTAIGGGADPAALPDTAGDADDAPDEDSAPIAAGAPPDDRPPTT